MPAGNAFFRVHGGEGDAAADADLIGGAAHLVGEGSACFEKAGGAAADHGGVGGESAAVDVFRFEAALEGDRDSAATWEFRARRGAGWRHLAMQELLRGMHVASTKPGMAISPRASMVSLARTCSLLSVAGPIQAMLLPAMAMDPSRISVPASSKATMSAPVNHRSAFSLQSVFPIARLWYASWSNDISISRADRAGSFARRRSRRHTCCRPGPALRSRRVLATRRLVQRQLQLVGAQFVVEGEAQVDSVFVHRKPCCIGRIKFIAGFAAEPGFEEADKFRAPRVQGSPVDKKKCRWNLIPELVKPGHNEVDAWAHSHVFQGLRLVGNKAIVGVSGAIQQGLREKSLQGSAGSRAGDDSA